MNVIRAVQVIKHKFAEGGSPAQIPLLNGDSFTATITAEGVNVDNLGNQPSLPWVAFQEAVCVLMRCSGRARPGSAMAAHLGDPDLALDSVEGHIAFVVYGKQPGDMVFRRIAPIRGILLWAGICDSEPGELILRQDNGD